MNTMHAPCGLTHHDEPPSDASRWCAHWAAYGARVLSEREAARLFILSDPKNLDRLKELTQSNDPVVARVAADVLRRHEEKKIWTFEKGAGVPRAHGDRQRRPQVINTPAGFVEVWY